MIPIQSRIRDMALAKSSALAPVASTDPAQVSFSWSGSSFECSPLSNPSAPPPTPTDSLLDIHPRKSSFSSEYVSINGRLSRLLHQRLSLRRRPAVDARERRCRAPELDEDATKTHEMVSSLTMEQQLARMRAVAEEEDRLRFLAKVEAHARATQALRQTKLAMHDRDTTSSKRKKRRVVPTPKRRAHSSSAKVSIAAH
ncbi:uncharacterized protein N7458_012411 [Penicillium daleae]|uniref:Uncharacterized protein n=1 Tax=Penicillium daleae TaxID=63821 RepID=A0AAD6BWJ7_9EURO|nr:uncharacterized protein N7458_012411 [Penicillium daleae]KAJ5433255.1 hypothetical protein N7458_012411 [Penicillium daleae]